MEGLCGEAKGRGGWEVGGRFNRKVEPGISGKGNRVNGRHGQTGEGNIRKGSEGIAYILYIYSIYIVQINKKNTKIIHPRSK